MVVLSLRIAFFVVSLNPIAVLIPYKAKVGHNYNITESYFTTGSNGLTKAGIQTISKVLFQSEDHPSLHLYWL